ncbi:MAG: 16S rRNA (cytosine(1402)-N(4))-methyltransferase [Legionellales bacterium RIFCSPHIGHO2_12_FULL_37_14]|nr:MAG: 16S rRNA (cytosine(1402)-N(4))-methyltransferase [Legionellales bacterium RIFCSPHIGHO2_12_FULL_37_14]
MLTHESVMLNEAINGLAIEPDGIYVDATFGRGGHAKAILENLSLKGRLLAIDQDKAALDAAYEKFSQDKRFTIFHASFTQIKSITQEAEVYGRVKGVLFDLGLSSPQVDDATRGFSFLQDGPLDMRMNLANPYSAQEFIQNASEKELAEVFFTYGEERYARRIAKAIVNARKNNPIRTTFELAAIVKAANPKWEKHKHPATRVFQAIRIYINDELGALRVALEDALELLAKGGRLVVISFHSLEDRIVKQFMKLKAEGPYVPYAIPLPALEVKSSLKRIGKAIKPSKGEIERNVRARSAILRIGEKLT